jgi:hypothetical protein
LQVTVSGEAPNECVVIALISAFERRDLSKPWGTVEKETHVAGKGGDVFDRGAEGATASRT